jgi:hypothetical protein
MSPRDVAGKCPKKFIVFRIPDDGQSSEPQTAERSISLKILFNLGIA